MKNTKSLQELIVAAASIFNEEKFADVSTVYASEDGFVFIDENRAKLHVKQVKDLKYYPITRAQALGNSQDPDGGSAEDLEELKKQYQELFGKAPHHNIGKEKLSAAIADKLASSVDAGTGAGSENQNKENDGQTTGN